MTSLPGIAAHRPSTGARFFFHGTVAAPHRESLMEELRESEDRFRALADDSPMMIWVTDPLGQVQIFEPFTQADDSLARSHGGLGLGLALVKGLVDLHGGQVDAASEGIGRGSTFTVRLPLDEAQLIEEETAQARPRVGRRVLVIEDNVDAADSLDEALQLDGHEVAVAYSGPDGLARARAFHPDVVLCDIGLPEMDGYEVARAFRSDPRLSGAYLVALTGYARPDDLRRASEAGFDRHLAKPPSLDKLHELLVQTARR